MDRLDEFVRTLDIDTLRLSLSLSSILPAQIDSMGNDIAVTLATVTGRIVPAYNESAIRLR